jgi:enolase
MKIPGKTRFLRVVFAILAFSFVFGAIPAQARVDHLRRPEAKDNEAGVLGWDIVIKGTGAHKDGGTTLLGEMPSIYGPHILQEGLRPLYDRIAWARKNPDLAQFKIKKIYAFTDQKHGMEPKDSISFGIVLGDDHYVVANAPVMGGISSGGLEPATHKDIDTAIDFFNKNVSGQLKELSIADPDSISEEIARIDEELRAKAEDKTQPPFSYIGAELAVGISMISTLGLAEELHVPPEVVINYRYNEYAMSHNLESSPRPMSIPVNFSVVWEGGKHGAAKYLPELVKEGIILDDSRFPARFKDPELIKKSDKTILLAMVPPQELQILTFSPEWDQARDIGKKITNAYKEALKKNGIKTRYGAESGFTTDQTHTADGKLINLELVIGTLEKTIDSLTPEERRYVRFALDIASGEMYIPEINMYYIGVDAARKVDPANKDGLVTNDQFTEYKVLLFKDHPLFISCEDWATDDRLDHWDPSARLIMDKMIQMGDDVNVSRADLIRKHNALGIQNAHLHKPNQVSEERESMNAVATSHLLDNVVVWSHRGTRSAQESYTSQGAIGTGSFGAKWTLWGVGRGLLIAIMNQANKLYNLFSPGVTVPYQGGLVLDPNGPYKDNGWAKRLRAEVAQDTLKIIASDLGTDATQVKAALDSSRKIHEAVGKPFNDFVVEALKLSSSDKDAGERRFALIVHSSYRAKTDAIEVLREIVKMKRVVALGIYGQGAEELRALLDGKAVIAAKTKKEDVVAELQKKSGLPISKDDIVFLTPFSEKLDPDTRQISFSEKGLAALDAAKALDVLLKKTLKDKVMLGKLYDDYKNTNVISAETYDQNKDVVLYGFDGLKDGKLFLPAIEPSQATSELIQKDVDSLAAFVQTYV